MEDVSIVFVTAAFPNLLNRWRKNSYSRALENQVFMIAANRIGSHEEFIFFDQKPRWEILIETGEVKVLLTCKLNLERVRKVREKIFHLRQRKLKIYGFLKARGLVKANGGF